MRSGELIIEESENVIRISAHGVDSLNPVKTRSQSAKELLSLIYEPLYWHGEDLKPQGALAVRTELSADGLFASVFLAEGITWQDGSPFCAEDVVYTINQIKSGESSYKNNVAYIASASAAGDGSVWLALYEPCMNLEGFLSFPIIKNGSAAEIEDTPNGTGAFRVEEKNAARLYLVPNEHGHAADTSVSGVRVRLMRDAVSCENAFNVSELDAITSSSVELGQRTPSGNIQIKNYTSNRLTFLGFNNTKDKYSSPYFKCVVSEIINREKLIDTAVYGRAEACRIPVNPKAWFYSETDGLELDIQGTMQVAGYTQRDGAYFDEGGRPAEIKILVSEENAQRVAAAEVIASQLIYAGISAVVERVNYDEYLKRINDKSYDAFIGEVTCSDNLDPGILTNRNNYFGFSSQELDDALYSMRTCGEAQLTEALSDYERVFLSNPPFAPLYYVNDGVVYSGKLSGITEPNFYSPLTGLNRWYFGADTGKE